MSASPVSRWRAEPFRLFFVLAVPVGWLGVGHWALYATGVKAEYSCLQHGLIQAQPFLMAFALGFLLTAVPRRTQGAPPSRWELGILAAAIASMTVAAALERWIASQLAYVLAFAVLLAFAGRRFVGRAAGRRPPAAFVLIPMGVLHGLAGAACLLGYWAADAPVWTMPLGRLLVEQGVFLCFAVGAGSLVLPLMGGTPPPADLGSSPVETRRAVAYALVGVAIAASLVAEAAGHDRLGPLVRGVAVGGALAFGAGAWRPPATPGLHRRITWLAVWCMPLGLLLAAALPDYRIPALHVLFIGGFSLLAFGVGTHVTLSHLDRPDLALGRPAAVWFVGGAVGIAMVTRLAADWSDRYFGVLGLAAAAWLTASAVWLAFVGPKLLRRRAPA